MGKTWVGTSWKMNKLLADALSYADDLATASAKTPHPDLVRFLVPPFTCMRQVKERLADTDIKVGAQNVHWDDDGPWTGEVSPLMLKDCGMDVVEIGHSERREFFGETDEAVGRKVAATINHGLVPVMCIGESRETRDAGLAGEFLEQQIRTGLGNIPDAQKDRDVLVAYEPIWAIGVNGIPATTEYAAAQHAHISKVAESVMGRRVPVIYGGSVNPKNCVELVSQPEIDGLFIGRAAWTAAGFVEICSLVSDALHAK